MTKKDYVQLARILSKGYAEITNVHVKSGYNLAIKDLMRFFAGENPRFDAVKFAAATYTPETTK